MKVKVSELTALQPCIFLAMEHPSHLERGLASEEEEAMGPCNDEDAAIINRVEASQEKADHGLSIFQRIPKGMKGHELFFHQIDFRQREYARRVSLG